MRLVTKVENVAAITNLEGAVYKEWGELEIAWTRQTEALAARPWMRKPRRLFNVLEALTDIAAEEGDPLAALRFQGELLTLVQESGNALAETAARLVQTRLLLSTGANEAALIAAQHARASALGIPDAATRPLLVLRADVAIATALQPRQPKEAESLLTDALRRTHLLGERNLLVQILVQLGSLAARRGDSAAAATTFRAALSETDREQVELGPSQLRNAYLERVRSIVAAQLEAAEQQGLAAAELLNIVETWRQRARGPVASKNGGRQEFASVPAALGNGLIYRYFVTQDRLYRWLESSTGLRLDVLDLPVGGLRHEIAELLELARGGAEIDSIRRAGARLGELLLPGTPSIESAPESLFVEPDGVLYAVPWALLVAPGSNFFLVEATRVTVIEGGGGAPPFSSHFELPQFALLAGDSVASTAVSTTALPNVETELTALAELYPKSQILTGRALTGRALESALGRVDVFHLVAHSQSGDRVDGAGAWLTNEFGGVGLWSPRVLAPLSLRGLRLAVLAGCGTGIGPVSSAEGVHSLAGDFLRQGTGAVVASLWAIDDAAASRLSLELHHRLAAGADPAAALRDTQLTCLRSNDAELASAATWGAFEVWAGSPQDFVGSRP